jgi:hypothetical protein
MTASTRHDDLQALGELSEGFPAWRLGPMIANLAVSARGATAEAIWEVEDEELLAAIREHLDRRRAPVPADCPPEVTSN